MGCSSSCGECAGAGLATMKLHGADTGVGIRICVGAMICLCICVQFENPNGEGGQKECKKQRTIRSTESDQLMSLVSVGFRQAFHS